MCCRTLWLRQTRSDLGAARSRSWWPQTRSAPSPKPSWLSSETRSRRSRTRQSDWCCGRRCSSRLQPRPSTTQPARPRASSCHPGTSNACFGLRSCSDAGPPAATCLATARPRAPSRWPRRFWRPLPRSSRSPNCWRCRHSCRSRRSCSTAGCSLTSTRTPRPPWCCCASTRTTCRKTRSTFSGTLCSECLRTQRACCASWGSGRRKKRRQRRCRRRFLAMDRLRQKKVVRETQRQPL
mmetsp:Transcript_11147/g.26275  ORF Transcript_11147/g.26275 Transcript_11147/m.26275 type:complete len:238 (-) Transcript_11147:4900-5613(-)